MKFVLYVFFLTFTTYASEIDNLCTKKRKLEKLLVKADEEENQRIKARQSESDNKPYNRYIGFIGTIK